MRRRLINTNHCPLAGSSPRDRRTRADNPSNEHRMSVGWVHSQIRLPERPFNMTPPVAAAAPHLRQAQVRPPTHLSPTKWERSACAPGSSAPRTAAPLWCTGRAAPSTCWRRLPMRRVRMGSRVGCWRWTRPRSKRGARRRARCAPGGCGRCTAMPRRGCSTTRRRARTVMCTSFSASTVARCSATATRRTRPVRRSAPGR